MDEGYRSREVDAELRRLEQSCPCGAEKMLMADGTKGEQCRECQNRYELKDQREDRPTSRRTQT